MKRIFTAFLAVILAFSVFSCDKKDTEKPSYPYKTVTIEGINTKDCTVVISRSAYIKAAEKIVESLSGYNGHRMPIKKLSEISDSDKNIILIGAFGVDGSNEKFFGLYGYNITAHENERVVLSVDFSTAGVSDIAVNKLISLFSERFDGKTAVISLKEKKYVGYSFETELSRWVLKEETVSTLTEGVTYTYQYFTDGENRPFRAYVLKIDPSKAYLYMGTSSDGYDYTVSESGRKTVRQHIDAAIGNGITPIAAVNADFFDISGDYHPKGLCIKEGKVIAGVRGRPWCGFTADGKFVCGDAALYAEYEGKLRTAVGASNVVVSNGAAMSDGMGGPHPRTLAGVTEDGTIILAVIDGRQPELSNGAAFAQCAAFMISHGAVNAVNLDGGGSSTMIVLGENGYQTKNSPSDGKLRKVYNSLLVVPIDK